MAGAGIAPKTFDCKAMTFSPCDDLVFVRPLWQLEQCMQACGYAADAHGRSVFCQRSCQAVASSSVDQAAATYVMVVCTRGDELGKCQLIEGAALRVSQLLCRSHVIDETSWNHKPAEAESRRQALAGGTGINNVIWCQGLQGAGWMAVEAELTVVVVLDHDALAGSSPANRLGAPLRREDDAEGELVCRSEQHRVGFTGLTERGAASVDRQWLETKSCRNDGLAMADQTVGFRRERGCAMGSQHLAEQPEPLGKARADDNQLGVRAYTACTRQVFGKGAAQLGAPARV